MAVGEARRVAPAYDFHAGPLAKAQLWMEFARIVAGPGETMNMLSGQRFTAVRDRYERADRAEGVQYRKGEAAKVVDIPCPDGQWDPYKYMPRFVFDAAEDAFPIDPGFDGTPGLGDNAKHHQDGVLGGAQAPKAAFVVSRKGEYTVLTYSFYMATNKAVHYHGNDYATAQVYLKDGKPAFLATSWHHGMVLTPWTGRPTVKVERGSHALRVVDGGKTEGVAIAADGKVSVGGKPTDLKLAFDALQGNVAGARQLKPGEPSYAARLEALRWGDAALDPFLPESFAEAPGAFHELAARVGRGARKAATWLTSGWRS